MILELSTSHAPREILRRSNKFEIAVAYFVVSVRLHIKMRSELVTLSAAGKCSLVSRATRGLGSSKPKMRTGNEHGRRRFPLNP